jgi:diguanylate cyclase (GGDEF)-like protein
MKLHHKLYLFFAGLVLIPLLLATIAASIYLGHSGSNAYKGRIESCLAAASAMISGQAQMLAGDARAALSEIDAATLIGDDPGLMSSELDSLVAGSAAAGASIMDADGKVIATSGEQSTSASPMIAYRVWLNGQDGGRKRLTVYRPFDSESLNSVFTSQGLDWAVIENGMVSLGTLETGREVTGSEGNVIDQNTAPESDGFQKVRHNGAELIASSLEISADVSDRDLLLLVAVPESVAGAASSRVLEVGLTLMLLVAAMAATLGYLLARNITRPLRVLNRAVSAGIEGDLGNFVEVRSKDELGSLSRSFNRMQQSIRSYIGELEESRGQLLQALSYTGAILGSTSDRRQLVKATAAAARLATGARGVWVWLFESDEPPGHEAVSAGEPVRLFQGNKTAAVEALALEVAAGKAPAGEPVWFDRRMDMVAYPMVHDRKTLGALVAVYRNEDLPADSYRNILGSLALQAASALENVNFSELQRQLAVTDPMTSLHNFRYLTTSLDHELSKSDRYGHELSLAIIDLDDFKAVNDKWGHPAGDALLKAVAIKLKHSVREADIVARYGGEEFALVLPETAKQAAMKLLEKLRREIAAVRLTNFPEVRVTASIGLASFPSDACERQELVALADAALYRAKMGGKNRAIAA